MTEKTLKLIKELSEISGPSSYEDRVITYMKKELAKYYDEVIHDKRGSTLGVRYSKNPDAPKVMIVAHMDEIGFMITNIDDDGMAKFKPLGGWWALTMISQRVLIHTKEEDIVGIITTRRNRQTMSDEQRAKQVPIEDMVIDFGASSKKEALEFGVRPGTYMSPIGDFLEMKGGKRVVGKAFDDRAGCAAVIEMMENLKDVDLPCHLYAGGSTEEEGGVKSAAALANMIEPDVFIAVDCSHARDFGGKNELSRLGEGFLLRFLDGKMRPSKRLVDFMEDLAVEKGVKYQLFNSYGGTDAATVQSHSNGILTGVVGIPVRYNHTHSVVMEKSDYEDAKSFLTHFVKSYNQEVFTKMITF